jgi:hypothetical protein
MHPQTLIDRLSAMLNDDDLALRPAERSAVSTAVQAIKILELLADVSGNITVIKGIATLPDGQSIVLDELIPGEY